MEGRLLWLCVGLSPLCDTTHIPQRADVPGPGIIRGGGLYIAVG